MYLGSVACISHHLTAASRDTTAMISLLLLVVLDALSRTPVRAKRLAPNAASSLTHFASPRWEKGRPDTEPQKVRRFSTLKRRECPVFGRAGLRVARDAAWWQSVLNRPPTDHVFVGALAAFLTVGSEGHHVGLGTMLAGITVDVGALPRVHRNLL